MFNQPALLITDITIVQDVLINNTYDYVKPMNIISDAVAFIGRGLALSEGEDHKRQRKMMNPAFTHSNIKLISVIEDKINLGESNIILTPYISQATLDIIGLVERESKNLVKRKYKEAEIGELKDDLLSVLIKLNKTLPIEEKLTDEELKYQIMTFLLAGHETTNISTNWALYLLSQHPLCRNL
ncbi:cytochrome P450 [Rhizophagus irregularis]|uniref:Cytochrome P450 n=1 Tax=Rhizophagus irregularis TaxID=588596 RepID=A0A2N0QBR9_9GLOM|nr:cytochrome P450 [Rhizophagus irregularis]